MNKRIPLGRLGKPDDLAGPVVFLLSDMAGYGELLTLGDSIGVMQKADRFRAEQSPAPPFWLTEGCSSTCSRAVAWYRASSFVVYSAL